MAQQTPPAVAGEVGAAAGAGAGIGTGTGIRSGTDTGTGAWAAEIAQAVPLLDAIAIARKTAADLTGHPVDGIAASGRHGEGGWRVVVDVIESPARMGENDLLSSHEVLLTGAGEVIGFSRVSRHHREDGGAP